MNSEIKKILGESIKIDDKDIPVSHIKYDGSSNTYIIWTIVSDTSNLKGDDEDLYSIVQVDIDIYNDKNYLKIMEEIKKKMKLNEWVWVEDSAEMFEIDTQLYHRTCTFEKERSVL